MSFQTSIARRNVSDQIEQARDFRSDEQRLAAAIDRHLSNVSLRDALNRDGALLCEQTSRRADLACEDSQAQLWRLIEDEFCCDPRKLAKALSL